MIGKPKTPVVCFSDTATQIANSVDNAPQAITLEIPATDGRQLKTSLEEEEQLQSSASYSAAERRSATADGESLVFF